MTIPLADGIALEPVPPERSGEVSEMAYPIYWEVYSKNPPERVEWFLNTYQSPESIREQILSGTAYCFILVDGGRAGYLAYEKDPEGMRLSKLYLLKEYRGRGIGSHLLEYVEDRAREEGLRRVHLEVNIYRTASRHFYESHGYAEADILDGYRIIMAKVL